MGSKVYTTSSVADNRLAVTDDAFGMWTGGRDNKTTLAGHIITIGGNNKVSGGAGSPLTAGGAASGINVSVLDGGAISGAFGFADNALSSILENVINGQQLQQSAAEYTADAIGSAIQSASNITNAAAAASSAAAGELQTNSQAFAKKVLVVGALALFGWWLYKGKK